MHRKVAAAIVAVLALAVASCGGSEKTTLQRPDLIQRVELACRAAGQTAERQSRTGGSNPYKALAAGQRLLVDRLEKIEGPEEIKDDFTSFKEGVRKRLDAIEKVASASRADAPRVLRSVRGEAIAAGRQITAAVDKLGLRGCG